MHWLIFVYRVPNHPTSKRVYVWRKLKKLGAVSLQDAVFCLPFSEKNREHFLWLAAEISEMDGEATVWESRAANQKQDTRLREEFIRNSNDQYDQVLGELDKVSNDTAGASDRETRLDSLYKTFLSIRQTDYFQSSRGMEVRDRVHREILKVRGIPREKENEE